MHCPICTGEIIRQGNTLLDCQLIENDDDVSATFVHRSCWTVEIERRQKINEAMRNRSRLQREDQERQRIAAWNALSR
jgi:hypothetical protein